MLPLIGALKKLCNHPQLVWDMINSYNARDSENGMLDVCLYMTFCFVTFFFSD